MTWAQQEDGHSTSVSQLCVGTTAAQAQLRCCGGQARRRHVRQRQKEETEIASGLREARDWVLFAQDPSNIPVNFKHPATKNRAGAYRNSAGHKNSVYMFCVCVYVCMCMDGYLCMYMG